MSAQDCVPQHVSISRVHDRVSLCHSKDRPLSQDPAALHTTRLAMEGELLVIVAELVSRVGRFNTIQITKLIY